MKRTCLSFVISLALLHGGVKGANAQQPTIGASAGTQAEAKARSPLDKRSENVRRAVEKVGIGGRITVFAKDGPDHRGFVESFDGAAFQIVERKTQQVVAYKYADVKRARRGWRKPLSTRNAAIFAVAMVGGLALLVPVFLKER